ncbi:MAG: indolepyruvate ferredoxin oxidoreductase subunit alpha [Bacillota bacterium]|nr:indolepyruvate ferredoxin oxidoreductase subunit alpha [Bacillota bacterium]
MKELLMGNEAAALGALAAGVQLVSGYPGTPSTETLETVARRNPGGVHVEWSVNEKTALEVAAGAALAGARALVTMKQVGLNVASDPLMCVNYIGVKGALVVYVADDPGPISSQTEQDTRHFGKYAKLPVFDCSSPEEALEMMQEAFALSARYGTPVLFRSTTRICHSCASVEVPALKAPEPAEGFVKDPRWVIFPRLSFESKKRLEARETELASVFASYPRNQLTGSGKLGVACGGDSFAYVMDAIRGCESAFTVFKVATPYPFPAELADRFLEQTEQVLVFEELDPVIEDALIYRCGKTGSRARILGKRTGSVPNAGELSALIVGNILAGEFKTDTGLSVPSFPDMPSPPPRPPVLCAGCPHRASFYAVKRAMKGRKAIFCGDIGCYTLGNAAPLNMVDTCLCMGAGISMAQGLYHADPDTVNFAFVGDSTFFASGIPGVVNAICNKADMVLVVLDNSTTAMTGHQSHPGTGRTVMGEAAPAVDIAAALKGLGLRWVRTVDPLDLEAAVAAAKAAGEEKGVRALIFKSPCIALEKPAGRLRVERDRCTGCGRCFRELGCPALSLSEGKAAIDPVLCTGCTLCSQVCPADAFSGEVE